MMRWFKADWMFPAIVLAPMATLVVMLTASSWEWLRNASTQRHLIAELVVNEPVLEPIRSDAERLQVRKIHELMAGSAYSRTWYTNVLLGEQVEDLLWTQPESLSKERRRLIDQLNDRFKVLDQSLKTLMLSTDSSLHRVYPATFQYEGIEHGYVSMAPVWLLVQIPTGDLGLTIRGDEPDPSLVMNELTRLYGLTLPAPNESISWNHSLYLSHPMRITRIAAAKGWLNDEQYAELDRILKVSIDWEQSWIDERSNQAWLAGLFLQNPEVTSRSRNWFGSYSNRASRSTQDEPGSYAPSETLAIARALLPPKDRKNMSRSIPVTDRSVVHFYGIDQWLKSSGLTHRRLPILGNSRMQSFSQSLEKTQKEILFTRVCLAVARLKDAWVSEDQSGAFTFTFTDLARFGWSSQEIADAEEELSIEPSLGGLTITSRSADWIRDGQGNLLDGGDSKQVRFEMDDENGS
ncbi:hypothetical protein [Neorhodopirellula pilleata]|uniref:Uncharacterized protein n=1 Tax=Neorhodopirellula pilleata TaxID=2714738 RepID=A0A5C6AV75_9BACT|nr:hypothetical protein [Neorhodopirellula pilleata]TWU02024.1 hypothetical protein Pla100_17600 [Neorhodopirellula pilleata]